ncbi:deoxyhypusine synthase [Halegenticoccus soli]|uniref:deoxyhypusine synthase n=1 Tax=Halegenticoccus soli TaxID=1985678 RepID=UPI000C6EC923|nr:deoxyhypusine synthase [Halegenticoccus soli]
MSDDHEYEPPRREEFSHDPIDHAEVRGGMTVGELAAEYGNAGIGAAKVHEAVDIYAEMLDPDVTCFLSLAGAMVPAGMRRVVSDLVRDGYVDALVTTGANLTHDAIEAIGGKHHHGRVGPNEARHGTPRSDSSDSSDGSHEREGMTPREFDEALRDEEVDRIYNVYLPQEHFALFESHLRSEVFPPLEGDGAVSIARLTRELGRANAEVNEREGVAEDPGIAAAAYECDVPVYCPAVQDSVLGLQAWMYSQTSAFTLDALQDMTPLTDLAFEAETAGCLLVGGGVPKNFTLQTMLVTPGAYDYAVQITMDPDATGGLSGATLDEARSWGKLEKDARNATVVGDATILLPLLVAAARERVE